MKPTPPIDLLPIGGSAPDPQLIRKLARRLKKALRTKVRILDPVDPLDVAAPAGSSTSSNTLVDALMELDGASGDPPERWLLGVTTLELHAPERAFVFGEATLGGGWAVVSSARFRDARHGGDDELLLARLLTESIHEIGHLAGLEHCRRPSCVMHPSASVEEIDRKKFEFCDLCGESFFQADRS